MLGFSPIFEVFSGLPAVLTEIIFGTADRPNINKWPGAKFGKNSLNYFQCSFVYPYPSVSVLAGGNSDHGPRKTRTKTQTTPDSVFIGDRRNSDHGLSFWRGKTQTMVWVSGVFGVGVDEGALILRFMALFPSLNQNQTRACLSSAHRAMPVCDAMCLCNPRCESRDFRALMGPKQTMCAVRCASQEPLRS